MEGEEEPSEIKRMKLTLAQVATDVTDREWLSHAMEASWAVVGALAEYPELADLLGERHRIVANDWQSAGIQSLIGHILTRAVDLLERIDFSRPQSARTSKVSARPLPTCTRLPSCWIGPPTCSRSPRSWSTTTSVVGASSEHAVAGFRRTPTALDISVFCSARNPLRQAVVARTDTRPDSFLAATHE